MMFYTIQTTYFLKADDTDYPLIMTHSDDVDILQYCNSTGPSASHFGIFICFKYLINYVAMWCQFHSLDVFIVLVCHLIVVDSAILFVDFQPSSRYYIGDSLQQDWAVSDSWLISFIASFSLFDADSFQNCILF